MPLNQRIDHEIRLRHLTVEEALYRLDKYLDTSFMQEIEEVRIIHGKGSGKLSNAVWQVLENHPLVSNFRFASLGYGGHGVTVAGLEKRHP
jgi:DNA mismatch repair protein MutS2